MTAGLRQIRKLYPGCAGYLVSLQHILKGYFAQPDVLSGSERYASRQSILQARRDIYNDLIKEVLG